jgi:hypothetical protein
MLEKGNLSNCVFEQCLHSHATTTMNGANAACTFNGCKSHLVLKL